MDEALERGNSSSDPSSSLMNNLPCPNLRLTPDRLQYFRQQQMAAQQNDHQSSNNYSLPITRSQMNRSAASVPTTSSSTYCATDSSYYQTVPHHDRMDSSLLHRQDAGVIVANNQNRIADQDIVEYPPYNPDEGEDDDDDDDDDSSYSENSEDEYSSEEEGNGKVQPNGIMNRTAVDGAGAVRMQSNHVPLASSSTASSHLPSFPSFTHPNLNHHHVSLTGLQHQNQYLNLSQQSPFLPQTSIHGSQVLLLPSHPSNNFLNNRSISTHPPATVSTHPPATAVTANSFHHFYAHHPFLNTSSTSSSLPIFPNHTITSNIVAQSAAASNQQQPLLTQTGRRDSVLTGSYHGSSNPNNQVSYSSIEEDHYYTDLSLSIPHHRHKNVNGGVIFSSSSTHHPNSGNSTAQLHQNLTISNDYNTGNESLGIDGGEDEDLSVGSNCSYDTHNTESSCEPIEIESTSDQCLIPPSSSSEGDDNFGEIIKQTMQVDSISASV